MDIYYKVHKPKKMSGIQYSIVCTFHCPLRIHTPQSPTKTQTL